MTTMRTITNTPISRRFISLEAEDQQKIAKAFGVTRRAIRYALSFDPVKGKTENSRRIRSYALQLGGREMVEIPAEALAEVETEHETAERRMLQRFPHGTLLSTSIETGEARIVSADGQLLQVSQVSTLADLYAMQARAAELDGKRK